MIETYVKRSLLPATNRDALHDIALYKFLILFYSILYDTI